MVILLNLSLVSRADVILSYLFMKSMCNYLFKVQNLFYRNSNAFVSLDFFKHHNLINLTIGSNVAENIATFRLLLQCIFKKKNKLFLDIVRYPYYRKLSRQGVISIFTPGDFIILGPAENTESRPIQDKYWLINPLHRKPKL